MLPRRKILLSKIESTQGTDSSPVVGSDLIMPQNDIAVGVPTEQDSGAGELKSTMGPGEATTMKQSQTIPVEARVRGLGTGAGALIVPDLHPYLMASGHAVVSSGDGSGTPRKSIYSPISDQALLKTHSTYLYEDGLLYKLLGAVNNLSFEASMSVLLFKANVQAPYIVSTVVALPSYTYPTPGLFKMTSALCVVSEDGSTVNIGAFTFDAGVDVQEAYETGYHYFEVADRDPKITIDPRAVATADDWNRLTNATTIAIVVTFTNAAGETLVFNAPKCVPMENTPGARAGRITRARTYALKETTGNDQYTITYTSVL